MMQRGCDQPAKGTIDPGPGDTLIALPKSSNANDRQVGVDRADETYSKSD